MSQRYLGGIITANPTTPTMTTESGVWTLEQQFQYSSVWSPKIVGNSVRLRSSASPYFNRTNSSSPTSGTKQTFSIWTKRGALGAADSILFGAYDGSSPYSFFIEFATDKINFQFGGASAYNVTSNAVYRDSAAWYHIVVSIDTTQTTAANRVIVYVNGQTVSLGTTNYPPQYAVSAFGLANTYNRIGSGYSSAYNYDGYMAEVNFIDGQTLTPSSFGAFDTNGVWQPLPYTGTYGTNGFYLTFADNSAATAAALGKDTSGNGNDWTPNNISLTAGTTYDWMLDSPTNFPNASTGIGNYAVLNPLWKGSNITLSGANLDASMAAASDSSFSSTFTITSGKWYWEARITTPSTDYPYIGVATPDFNYQAVGASCIRSSATGFFKASNATKWNTSSSAYGSSFSAGDIMMIAYDADAAQIYFGKNGVWDASSDPATGANPAFTGVNAPVTPAGFVYNCAWSMNFGQRPFSYTPPSNYKALNTLNLPDSNITNGAQYMAATTYTGTGSTQSISNGNSNTIGTTFKPDFVWVKERSQIQDHALFDSVRGATKQLSSNLNTQEGIYANSLAAFNSNGFTVVSDAVVNSSSQTYVGWQWQAGQGTTSSNTSGSITSTVSVSTKSGFSVVTYTGTGANATVGHGLGVAPKMVIVKARNPAFSTSWPVYHSNLTSAAYTVFLNSDVAQSSASTYWNSTAPSSSVFSIGTTSNTNNSLTNYVAYCWSEVAGYSKFGSYTGNGSADGPFVYCGFRPRFVLVKNITTTNSWLLYDTSRLGYNQSNNYLLPDLSNAEGSGDNFIDILSNGFKVRIANQSINTNGATYIYAAFAENPFKISRAR